MRREMGRVDFRKSSAVAPPSLTLPLKGGGDTKQKRPRLYRLASNNAEALRARKREMIPSPLVGEGEGGGYRAARVMEKAHA